MFCTTNGTVVSYIGCSGRVSMFCSTNGTRHMASEYIFSVSGLVCEIETSYQAYRVGWLASYFIFGTSLSIVYIFQV